MQHAPARGLRARSPRSSTARPPRTSSTATPTPRALIADLEDVARDRDRPRSGQRDRRGDRRVLRTLPGASAPRACPARVAPPGRGRRVIAAASRPAPSRAVAAARPRPHRARHRRSAGRQAAPPGTAGRRRSPDARPRLRPARRRRRAPDAGVSSRSTATPSTAWTTESYQRRHARQGGRRPLRRRRARRRRASRSRSTRRRPAGQARDLRRATGGAPDGRSGEPGDWQKVGDGTVVSDAQRITLDTGGKRFRYYLVWIDEAAARRGARRDLRGRACSAQERQLVARTRRRVRARRGAARGRAPAAGRRPRGRHAAGLPHLRVARSSR